MRTRVQAARTAKRSCVAFIKERAGRGGLSVARQLEVKSSHVMSCHPHPPRLAPAGAREWVCTYPLQLPQESHLALAQVSRVLGEFSIQEKGNFYTTISYHICVGIMSMLIARASNRSTDDTENR